MPQYSSPVIDALKDWKSQEDARQVVLGKDMSHNRQFLKSRLAAYKRIYKENQHLENPAHKEDLKALKGQIQELNKQLYSRRERLFRAAFQVVKAPLMPLLRPIGTLAAQRYDRLKSSLGELGDRLLRRDRDGPAAGAHQVASDLQAAQRSQHTAAEQPLELRQLPANKRRLKINARRRGTKGPGFTG